MRAQQYIGALLDNVAEGQIASDEHRLTFGKIKEKLAITDDFESELRSLYKVSGFTDFALSLSWIAERIENDPAKVEYTQEEQEIVVARFRSAVGDSGPVMSVEAPAEPEITEPETTPQEPVPEETPEMPAHLQMETTGAIDESEESVYAPPPGPASGTEGDFASLMEKFVEAMQSGAEDREPLLASVLEQCKTMIPPNSGVSDDLREFSQLLVDFLNYITENGFMDDVRVMNILSNVSGPVSSWAQASPDDRGGLLDEGLEILRTFKSLFE
ncbi:MAG: hypothetical protein HYW57_09945 [Ignavibacteriales bacterium]|nr:hypothetical protein [Ignavibacteriales bacterium]